MRKFNFSYDEIMDDLLLYYPKSKSKGSVEFGNFVLDFNNYKELVGIQITEASKLIKEFVGVDVKKLLKNLTDCKVNVKVDRNMLIVKIFLISKMGKASFVTPLPYIVEPSPALRVS